MTDYPSKYRNSRDVEIPLLLDFIRRGRDVHKILDVGCARSVYLPMIKDINRCIDCVDFEPVPELIPYLCKFVEGDVCDQSFGVYDLVMAISVIEHYGVKQKPAKHPFDKQRKLVRKMGSLTRKYLYVTFPFGEATIVRGEFIVYTPDAVAYVFHDLKDFTLDLKFFRTDNPAYPAGWQEVELEEMRDLKYEPKKGVCGLCIVEGVKKNV